MVWRLYWQQAEVRTVSPSLIFLDARLSKEGKGGNDDCVTKSVDLSSFHCFPPNSGALKAEYLHVSAQAWPIGNISEF